MSDLTPIQQRLLDAAVNAGPIGIDFTHAVLCQVGMPRKATDARVFERSSGNAMLRLEAGALYDGVRFVEQPLPYGTRPRLILVYLSGQAIRNKTRSIDVGDNMKEFLVRLGIDTSGGEKGGIGTFKKQMQALAACRLMLGYGYGDRASTINTQPIHQFDAWVRPDGTERVLWPSEIVLSQEFYETLGNHAVPLSHEAVYALKHSALYLDIYTWLAHRLCRIKKADGIKLSWYNLKDQFGDEYNDVKNFKRKFVEALEQVHIVYRDANIEVVEGGLLLKPSHPPIPRIQILT